MKLNNLVEKIHQDSLDVGAWRHFSPTVLGSFSKHNELSKLINKASGELLKGRPAMYAQLPGARFEHSPKVIIDQGLMPEGEAVELANVVVNILDYAGYMGWDMEAVFSAMGVKV